MPCLRPPRRRVLITPLLCMLITPALLGISGQQSVLDYIYGFCNVNVFNSNDTFATNYNAVVASFEQNSSESLYAMATSFSGSTSDYVYGIYQCRGDVSLHDCRTCVDNAFSLLLRDCGRVRGARGLFKGCFIRYENYAFDKGVEKDGVTASSPSCSNDTAPANSPYLHNLAVALNDSAAAAPKHAIFGYNASRVGSGSSAAYTLTQCMGYLSSSDCATCVAQVSNNSNVCNQSVSGNVYFDSCYYLYSNTSFLFNYTNSDLSGGNIIPSPSPALSPYNVQSPATSSTQHSVQGKKKKSTTPIIVGIVVGCSVALVSIVAMALVCFRKRDAASAGGAHSSADTLLYATNASPLYDLPYQPRTTTFSLKEMQEATNNFSPDNKLGEGGFGPVYQGRLTSGREVGIKMLSAGSHQGNKEFENEVNLITTVQHRNLIQLLGCCIEASKPLLVYEYLPNRSLDLHLFDVNENDALSWRTRFDIIVGIARGLTYLHEDSHVRIVHRDIKSSNILLDGNMNPKIADFGLARLFADDVSHVKTKVAGTLGYLAPEYAMSGQLTEKVDVYSFGVLALEILTGRRVLDYNLEADQQNLLHWAWTLYEKGQPDQIIDYRLQRQSKGTDVGEVIRVVHVALLCTQAQPHLRPSMSQVHSMLCGQSQIIALPTKPLTVGAGDELLHGASISSWSDGTSSHATTVGSHNRDSISEVQPR